MMTYITRDDGVVSDDALIHFHLGKFHYFMVEGVSIVSGAQRIPWELFRKKMYHNSATWYTPGTSAEASGIFAQCKQDVFRSVRHRKETFDSDNPLSLTRDVDGNHQAKSLVDVQREREYRLQRYGR